MADKKATNKRDNERDLLRVLSVQGDTASRALYAASQSESLADSATEKAERVLRKRGTPLPKRSRAPSPNALHVPALRSWEELLAEAETAHPGDMSLDNILSAEEIAAVNARLDGWEREFSNLHRLTAYDYAVAGTAGILAGLADVFLVKVPAHEGFLGSQGSEGGWLSNQVKALFGELLSEERIAELEQLYKVPYDVSTNAGLGVKIPNLGPRTHRLHSLGHDPILGWIFGVWDIFNGSITTIGGDGRLITQAAKGHVPIEVGWDVFQRLVDALKTVGGHMASDVATKSGLPPPLFVLLQFLQFGDFKGKTIAELSRAMYRSGYDFRHFLAGGVCVALIEVIVRTAWFARERHEGKSFKEAMPVGNIPRLQSSLFLAHTTATAVNAGKVSISRDPLSVSWAQWLAFFRYLLPHAHWILVGKASARDRFIKGKLNDGWSELNQRLLEDFRLQGSACIEL